ncbi:MAG: response regulator [Gammaproteobacteria bacterium]|nr:response regulator [Gammaproteobacteria bacterium]
MPTPLLICDDSSFARKQIAHALPEDWDVELSFAGNGMEALEAISAGRGDVVFLDLNMPVMDGYQVLEAVRERDLPAMAIVVSGDIQPEAERRVKALGALEFIRKPLEQNSVADVLHRFGIHSTSVNTLRHDALAVDPLDALREVINIAIGQAADVLARLLNTFVVMPAATVNMLEASELRMALQQIGRDGNVAGVCQGFVGPGIAGEAFMMINEPGDVARLMHYDCGHDAVAEIELLMDTANVMIGACLKRIAEQLGIKLSQGHPMLLGEHGKIEDPGTMQDACWPRSLATEVRISIENENVHCDLLILFTESSLSALEALSAYLAD